MLAIVSSILMCVVFYLLGGSMKDLFIKRKLSMFSDEEWKKFKDIIQKHKDMEECMEENCIVDYFGEKTKQIIPESMTAFGIDIVSRHGKVDEIMQMLQFAQKVALQGIMHYVTSIFYDSGASICNITMSPNVKADDPIGKLIYEAASTTLSQFIWFDDIAGLSIDND